MKKIVKFWTTHSFSSTFTYKITLYVIILIAVFLEVNAAPGDLDLTFGIDGTIHIDAGSNLNESAYAVATQTDGKIVIAGVSSVAATGQDFFVARLNTNGTLDTTFSDDGRLTFNFNNNSTGADVARAVAVQADGKIVITGESAISGAGSDIVVARLNPDGSFDTTFDGDGRAVTNLPGNRNEYGKSIVIQLDGKIVVAGYGNRTTTGDDFVTVRYNTNGSLDTTFNSTGIVTTDILTNRVDRAGAISLQSDGKIIVGGYTNDASLGNNFVLVRYNTDGSPDLGFNGTGKVTTDLNLGSADTGNAIALQNDGKIIIAGQTAADFGVVRYNSNGSVDTSFGGGDGIVTTNFGTDAIDIGYDVIVQNTGKIIVAGKTRTNLALARYTFDGTLDTSFNGDGFLIENAGNNYVSTAGGYFGITSLSNNNIVAVGEGWRDGFGSDFTVSRLSPEGVFDLSFGQGDGIAKTNYSKSGDIANASALQPDGKIVVAGYTRIASLTFDLLLVRYNTNGTLDTSFGNNGIVTTDINGNRDDYINAVAVQPDGKIVVTGETDDFGDANINNLFVIRYNSNGTLDSSFGTNGLVIVNRGLADIGNFFNLIGNDIAFQPDGGIIIAGTVRYFSITDDGFVAKLNSNGSFGFMRRISFNTGDEFTSVALQSDGKIVVAGFSFNGTNYQTADFILARLNIDGNLDTTFDGDGKVSTNFDSGLEDRATDIAIQLDGKIIAVGFVATATTEQDFAAARYNADGSLDTSFGGGDGILNLNFGHYDTCSAVALQPDGKILLGGRAYNGGSAGFSVASLNSNGTLNTNFGGGDGKVTALLYDSFPDGTVSDMILQPDGKIIVTGYGLFNSTDNDFVAVRFDGEASSHINNRPFDFDGDGKSDIGIYRPSGGEWWINRSSSNQTVAAAFGSSTDKIVPGDFTGDGKADMAFFRPSNGFWYILRSEDFSFYGFNFGASGDIPVAADFDGDGKADQAVFRPSNQGWYIQKSSGGIDFLSFGLSGDSPVVADYDGDGKADIAITRINAGNREWWIRRSSDNQIFSVIFGDANDRAVQGDYTGDGKADIAFWRPSNGFWYILRSENLTFYGFPFGSSGDTPTPGDYDGDGKFDAAVFRSSNSGWYQLRTTQGFTAVTFGLSNDIPVPTAFIP